MPRRKSSEHNPSVKIMARLTDWVASGSVRKSTSGISHLDYGRKPATPRRRHSTHLYEGPRGRITEKSNPVYQPSYPISRDQVVPWSPIESNILYYTPYFEPIPGIPLGIEPLSNTESVSVCVEREPIPFLMAYEKSFSVFNDSGQRIFLVAEVMNVRLEKHVVFDINPKMQLHVFDGYGKIVMHFVRQKDAGTCESRQPNNDLVVTSALSGQVYGFVQKDYNCCRPAYFVADSSGTDVMHIKSSDLGCFGSASFKLFYSSSTSIPVGSCAKKADKSDLHSTVSFGMNFPSTLPEEIKGTLLGALFNLYFSYFED